MFSLLCFGLNIRPNAKAANSHADLGTHKSTHGATQPDVGIPRRAGPNLRQLAEPQLALEPTWAASFIAIVRHSVLNMLLLLIPVSWALYNVWKQPSPAQETVIFVLSFLATIPLAQLLDFATDELALRIGHTMGTLLHVSLENAVELILAVIALKKCELAIVQSSLVGSILSNLLLVVGMCFFAGGTRFTQQGFVAAAAQLYSSLLTLSVVAVLFPAAFHFAVALSTDGNVGGAAPSNAHEASDILKMSRSVSIILLFIYGSYLLFQLWTHPHLYRDEGLVDIKSQEYSQRAGPASAASVTGAGTGPGHGAGAPTTVTAAGAPSDIESRTAPENSTVPRATINVGAAIILLALVAVLVALASERIVASISGVAAALGMSRECAGLILLPAVGNAAEHVRVASVCFNDRLPRSLSVAFGSSIQIALFVIPLLVVIAWIMGKPLSLLFDPFESVALFLAVITVNYTVADGKSNWLEGLILISLYVIIGVVFFFYKPMTALQQALGLACTNVVE